jgi:chemotaxis protein CheZ
MNATALPEVSRQQLGAIVRQLHDALRTLGYTTALQEVAQQISDARERLAYVGQMTERAAHKVLSLVDQAQPGCSELVREGQALLSSAVTPGDAAPAWQAFARKSVNQAQSQQDTLSSIMMAQDFQDLSGQVIHKVIAIISRTEAQLVELLMQNTLPADTQQAAPLLSGPQVPDKAMAQNDVDELLASMGF